MTNLKDGTLNLIGKDGNNVIMSLYSSQECQAFSEHCDGDSNQAITDAVIEAAVELGSFYSEDWAMTENTNSTHPTFSTSEILQCVTIDGSDEFLNETTGELISLRSKGNICNVIEFSLMSLIILTDSLFALLPHPKTPERKYKRAVKRTANVLTSKENIDMLQEVIGKKQRVIIERELKKQSTASKKEQKILIKLHKTEEREQKKIKKLKEQEVKKELKERKRIEKLSKKKC